MQKIDLSFFTLQDAFDYCIENENDRKTIYCYEDNRAPLFIVTKTEDETNMLLLHFIITKGNLYLKSDKSKQLK